MAQKELFYVNRNSSGDVYTSPNNETTLIDGENTLFSPRVLVQRIDDDPRNEVISSFDISEPGLLSQLFTKLFMNKEKEALNKMILNEYMKTGDLRNVGSDKTTFIRKSNVNVYPGPGGDRGYTIPESITIDVPDNKNIPVEESLARFFAQEVAKQNRR